jgi:hypothetical protein
MEGRSSEPPHTRRRSVLVIQASKYSDAGVSLIVVLESELESEEPSSTGSFAGCERKGSEKFSSDE